MSYIFSIQPVEAPWYKLILIAMYTKNTGMHMNNQAFTLTFLHTLLAYPTLEWRWVSRNKKYPRGFNDKIAVVLAVFYTNCCFIYLYETFHMIDTNYFSGEFIHYTKRFKYCAAYSRKISLNLILVQENYLLHEILILVSVHILIINPFALIWRIAPPTKLKCSE